MKLSEIVRGIELQKAAGNMEADITGLAYDSRNVCRGTLFVAIKGLKTDGHLYIKNAIEKGGIGYSC